MTTTCVKFSDCGTLGFENDLAVVTDCQYGEKRFCGVKLRQIRHRLIMSNTNGLVINTHFDFSWWWSLRSGQLTIVCPNLQVLSLQCSFHCLQSQRGLTAIASLCSNLQRLNLTGVQYVCAKMMEDNIQLWELLSNLICTLQSKVATKHKLVNAMQKCSSIREIECSSCDRDHKLADAFDRAEI